MSDGNTFSNTMLVDSTVGKMRVDSGGSAISGSRMEAEKAYAGIPALLQKVINEDDTVAWAEIVKKIDYIYTHIDQSLTGLDRETGFAKTVQEQVRSGKKLLFKPNLVGPTVIEPKTHGFLLLHFRSYGRSTASSKSGRISFAICFPRGVERYSRIALCPASEEIYVQMVSIP